jgi:hypothetical protein
VYKFVKLPGLVICGAMLCVPAAVAQEAGPAARAPAMGAYPTSATPSTATEAGANTDVAAASANTAGAPVVNPPDPQNAGTLAENARTTALATYPWSTADIWFGRR